MHGKRKLFIECWLFLLHSGGFMVVFEPTDESIHSFNFREMAPAASTADMFDTNPDLAKRVGCMYVCMLYVCIYVCIIIIIGRTSCSCPRRIGRNEACS